MVSTAFLLGAQHLWGVVENKPAGSLVVSLGKALTGRLIFMWKTGDPDNSEIATPKRVQTSRPKHSDASLSREWRINMAKKIYIPESAQKCSWIRNPFNIEVKICQMKWQTSTSYRSNLSRSRMINLFIMTSKGNRNH